MGLPDRDELGSVIVAAAEQFCNSKNIGLTTKRLLYEFLAVPGPNGKTLSGLCDPGQQAQPGATADVLYLTTRWMGFHIIKHYYVMRQYVEASTGVRDFLQFLRSEARLPADFAAALDAAIQIAKEGCEQLPLIMRISRQPDVLNEAFSFRYPSRPWPLCHVPQSTEVKESSSRFWPSGNEQHYHAWVSFISERCRVEPEEAQEVLDKVPVNLSVANKTDGVWQVMEVRPDHQIVFKEWQGSQEFVVQYSAKRAADFLPGMLMCATFVTLSNKRSFVTDCGYIFPTFYTAHLTSKEDFGPYDPVNLVYSS